MGKLHEELGKLENVAKGQSIHLWVTPKAKEKIGGDPNRLIAITVSAFQKSAVELGRLSAPILIGHYEHPEVTFVGTRLSGDQHYLFVVQAAVGEGINWLGLMSAAFTEAACK